MSQPPEYSEEELRALEAEMERITVDDVLLQTIVSLINIAARKAGLAHPPNDPNRPAPDWEQVRLAIEGARALMPIVEPRHGAQLGPIRDGLAQLQLHYARSSGAASAGAPGEPSQPATAPAGGPAREPGTPGSGPRPGEPKRPSKLWIPGQ